jgi:hypothetical protein
MKKRPMSPKSLRMNEPSALSFENEPKHPQSVSLSVATCGITAAINIANRKIEARLTRRVAMPAMSKPPSRSSVPIIIKANKGLRTVPRGLITARVMRKEENVVYFAHAENRNSPPKIVRTDSINSDRISRQLRARWFFFIDSFGEWLPLPAVKRNQEEK